MMSRTEETALSHPEGLALSPASRPTWRSLLDEGGVLQLPAAHDALTARLIARAGFKAYQVGGFALAGARYAFPDIDLDFYEENEAIRQIVSASQLPVLVDAGNGFGDAKSVVRTVRGYEELGVSGIFIEDQSSPITCGQMGKRKVVSIKEMVGKVKAAVAARRNADTARPRLSPRPSRSRRRATGPRPCGGCPARLLSPPAPASSARLGSACRRGRP
jgi:hypothetical protein